MELFGFIIGCVSLFIAGCMFYIALNEGPHVFLFSIGLTMVGIMCLLISREERTDIIPNKSYKGYEIDTIYTISNGKKIGVEYQIKEKIEKK